MKKEELLETILYLMDTSNKMFIDEKFVKFISPFTMIVAGPSGSGKTYLVRRLIENQFEIVINAKPKPNILWVYGVYQDIFEKPIRGVNIEYISEIPNENELTGYDYIIFDDLMNETANDLRIANLFTKLSHHKNINVIFIVQNLFHQGKQMRNLHLNTNYLILMKNTRDLSQIDILGRQLKICKQLTEAYKDATNNMYGYLLLDFKQSTPREFMLRTNIFLKDCKNFSPIIYQLV